MSFKIEPTDNNVTFSFTITFINAIKTGQNKVLNEIRKDFVTMTNGLFGVTFNMASINSKVAFAYKMIRREFNLLLDDIALYIDEKVVPSFFNTPNASGNTIVLGTGGTTFTWAPLKKNTLYKKDKYGGSPFQKQFQQDEFLDSLQAIRSLGAPGKIEIIVGFFDVDSGKVLANEFGTLKNYGNETNRYGERKGQPPRPILEPIYDALYHGAKNRLLPWLRNYNNMPDSDQHSIVLGIRKFREMQYYKSWFRVA